MTSEIIGPMTPKSLPQHLRNRQAHGVGCTTMKDLIHL